MNLCREMWTYKALLLVDFIHNEAADCRGWATLGESHALLDLSTLNPTSEQLQQVSMKPHAPRFQSKQEELLCLLCT